MEQFDHPELWSSFGTILDSLTEEHPSPAGAFQLHYATRNSPGKRSVGLSGIEHPLLLDTYSRALDRAYQHFGSENWADPVKPSGTGGGAGAIPVYVTRPESKTLDPFTLTYRGESSIWLRSLIPEADLNVMLLRAELDAVHEVTHVFTHRHHPPSADHFNPWKWFDEATAVFTERRLCGEVADCVRFGVYWSYGPEQALNLMIAEGGGYLAGWFLQYLAVRFKPTLVRDVWHDTSSEGPITALELWLRTHANTGIQDVFEEYACATYRFQSFAPDVHKRFGDRSITEWFQPSLNERVNLKTPDSLDPFSCRYYRIDVPEGAKRVDLQFSPRSSPQAGNLRATLLMVTADGQVGLRKPLSRGPESPVQEIPLSDGESLPPGSVEHVALVVVNVPPPQDVRLHDPVLVQEFEFAANIA